MSSSLNIALTGGIASGKTTAANYFKALGVTVIDADHIARDLVKPDTPALKEIVKQFGQSVLKNDQLDRQKLRTIIFDDPVKKQWLESLLHPPILKAMQQQANAMKTGYCILVIPLLAEIAPVHFIDQVIVVDSPQEQQIQRLMERDLMNETQCLQIIHAQATREARLALADYVIVNDGNLSDLKERVQKLHNSLKKQCL